MSQGYTAEVEIGIITDSYHTSPGHSRSKDSDYASSNLSGRDLEAGQRVQEQIQAAIEPYRAWTRKPPFIVAEFVIVAALSSPRQCVTECTSQIWTKKL